MNTLIRKGYAIVLVLLLMVSSIFAQELVISGSVISDETGESLPGAEVVVKGMNIGTATDLDGKFELKVPGMTQATLVVTFLGYKTQEVKVNSSTQNLIIRMPEDVLKGSEEVVTGLATSVKRENLANAVATLSAEELLPAPTQSVESALSGKFPGVSVSQNTGAPGGGINVNLRGVSTIVGNSSPLYVVDGVIVSNDAIQSGIDLVTKAAGAGSSRPQGQPVNRIADINPSDIEKVEVLKGASAAAIYGSKASNGVVIITTRRGRPGRTRIDVTQQLGFNSILHKIGTRHFTAETAEAQYGPEGKALFEQNGGKFIDQEDVMYGEKGLLSLSSVSIRGGTPKTTFYISGLFQDENGIIKRTGYQRMSGNVQVTHKFGERLSIDVFTNVIRTEADRGITGNDNTNTTFGFSLAFTPSFLDLRPKNGVYPDHPFNPSNPVHTRDVFVNKETVYRMVGSSRIRLNLFRTPTQNLDFILQSGFDYYSQFNMVYSPPELQFERNSDQPGHSLDGETRNLNSNLYLNLAYLYGSRGGVIFRTSAGFQFENHNLNNTLVDARAVTVTQTNVDQAGSINVFQDRQKKYDRGFYAQEEIDLKGKLFLTGGVRGDASSAHGNTDKFFLYPKASASLRLSQFNFWEGLKSFANEFKVRVAYGETGNSPPPDAKYISLVPRNIGGTSGVLFDRRRGNPNIKPERTKEIETGFDAMLYNGRASLEFTYYHQNISDLILIPSLPPSSGFTEEFINGGKMRTQGVEVGLGVNPIHRKKLQWTSRVSFYKTSSEITELAIDPFNIGGFATFLGTYRIQVGWSPTSIVGAERNPDGSFVKLGDETPDFEMGFNNHFKFGNLSFGFHLHWKNGGEVINLGKLITDLGGTTEDYDTGAAQERLGLLGTKTSPYIEDGSYLKLREAYIYYMFHRNALKSFFGNTVDYLKIGVSGRNLFMITNYTGYDPEVSQFGSVPIGRSVDTIPYPSSRSFYFNVSFGL